MYNIEEGRIESLIAEVAGYKERAYVPYSRFPVCALIIDNQGRKHFGVNVENASYGLTVCAERGALMAAVAQGMKHISLLVVAADTPGPVTPCGACRQVLAEFCAPDTPIVCANFKGLWKRYTMAELLPEAFDQTNLSRTQE